MEKTKAIKPKTKTELNGTRRSDGKSELIISIIALMISGLALWQSFKSQAYNSSANIQLVQTKIIDSNSVIELKNSTTDKYFYLVGEITIKNFGNAPTQIISVSWQPLLLQSSTDFDPNSQTKFVISDNSLGLDVVGLGPSGPPQVNEDPLAAIKNRTVNPQESKILSFTFYGPYSGVVTTDGTAQTKIYDVKIVITFSNGQELSIIPETSK